MNAAYAHLVLNHIPVIAVPIAAVLFAAALFWKKRDLALAGFVICIGVGVLAYPVMETGDDAMDTVHRIQGISAPAVHEHEEAGEGGTWGSMALGVLSLLGFAIAWKNNDLPKRLTGLILLVALVMSGWLAYVAHLGGLIRHPEIARGYVPPDGPETHTP